MQLKVFSPIIIFLLSLIFFFYAYTVDTHTKEFYESDFGTFYQSVKFFVEDKKMYKKIYFVKNNISNADSSKKIKNNTKSESRVYEGSVELNSPFFILLISPLYFFGFFNAYWIWLSVLFLGGILGIHLLKKEFESESFNQSFQNKNVIWNTLSIVLAFFIFYPTYASVEIGQATLLLFPLVVLAWMGEKKQNAVLSGSVLGMLATIKLFFGLFFFYFIFRREWQQLKYFILVFLGLNLLTLPIVGLNNYYAYCANLSHITWYAASWNVSILGFLTRLFDGSEGNVPLFHAPQLSHLLFLVISAGLFFSLLLFYRTNQKMNFAMKTNFDFSVTLVAMLLLSPLGWLYYFPFLIIPFVIVFQYVEYFPNAILLRNITAFSVMLCGFAHSYVAQSNITNDNALSTFIYSNFYFIALLILLALLFYLNKKLPNLNFEEATKKDQWSDARLLTYSIALLPSLFSILGVINETVLYGVHRVLLLSAINFGN